MFNQQIAECTISSSGGGGTDRVVQRQRAHTVRGSIISAYRWVCRSVAARDDTCRIDMKCSFPGPRQIRVAVLGFYLKCLCS